MDDFENHLKQIEREGQIAATIYILVMIPLITIAILLWPFRAAWEKIQQLARRAS